VKSKPRILLLGLLILLIGLVLAIPEVLQMHSMSNIEAAYNFKSYNYIYTISEDEIIHFKNTKVIYDDTLEDGVLIEVKYYEPFINNINVKAKQNNHHTKMEITFDYDINMDEATKTYRQIVSDLKLQYIYDYKSLIMPIITVRLNQKHKDAIIVD